MKNGPSPEWLQKRLKAIGLRPINVLVDVTNYISFDRARPLHVYDAAKLTGGIVAPPRRRGRQLRGAGRQDLPDLPRCASSPTARGAIGLGGVMGGADHRLFDRHHRRLRRKRLVRSDPHGPDRPHHRHHFRRPLPLRARRRPAFAARGIELATQLILDRCGGEPSEVSSPAPIRPRAPVEFKLRDMKRLTGLDMNRRAWSRSSARSASIPAAGAKDESGTVVCPTFRPDVEGSADIVEELIRIEGFDALPTEKLPPGPSARPGRGDAAAEPRAHVAARACRARLPRNRDLELHGARKAADDRRQWPQDALTIDNPIASDLDYMRPSMLANLAEAAQRNADHGAEDVRLFEAGPVYPATSRQTSACRSPPWSAAKGRDWQGAFRPTTPSPPRPISSRCSPRSTSRAKFQIGAAEGPYWHPGRSARCGLDPSRSSPRSANCIRLPEGAGCRRPGAGNRAVARRPAVAKGKAGKTKPLLDKADQTPIRRDFAFVVDEKVAAGDILRAAAKADPKLVAAVNVFDVYRGAGVGEGKKSVAIEVTIQPRGEALKDAEIDTIAASVVAAIQRHGRRAARLAYPHTANGPPGLPDGPLASISPGLFAIASMAVSLPFDRRAGFRARRNCLHGRRIRRPALSTTAAESHPSTSACNRPDPRP